MQFAYWFLAAFSWISQIAAAIWPAGYGLRLGLCFTTLFFAWRAATAGGELSRPIGWYLPISALYIVGPLCEIVLFGNRVNLDEPRMAMWADFGVTFLVCAALGSSLVSTRRGTDVYASRVPSQVSMNFFLGYTWALLVVGTSITVYKYGFAIGSISRAEVYAEGSALLSLVRSLLSLNFGFCAALIARREITVGHPLRLLRLTLYIALAAYVALDLLILGDRRLPLVAVVTTLAVLAMRRITWRHIVAATLAAALLALYGLVRNHPPSDWPSLLREGDLAIALSPAAGEFGGIAVIGQAIDDPWRMPSDFPKYDKAFAQVVPRAVSMDRPQAPTEWFVWTYFPALASIGASFAFNAVIEAVGNGGILMLVLMGLSTGCAISLVATIRWHGAHIGVPLAIYLFIFSMRMDFASLLRMALTALLGMVAVIFAERVVSALIDRRLWRPRAQLA